jgi:hypothetical protein
MTCPRPGCQGLLVPETVYDGSLALDLHRCLSCGRMGRQDEQLESDRLPHADPLQRALKQEVETVPRGPWTPEQRARFEKTMAERKGQPVKRASSPRAVVPVVHEAVVVEREPVDFSALDVVIEETRKDLEAMERTKEILARGR